MCLHDTLYLLCINLLLFNLNLALIIHSSFIFSFLFSLNETHEDKGKGIELSEMPQ